MLSYLHAFHAGNHADILKHITLIQILRHLNAKDSPYCFFDTHAGSALYSLESVSAEKTAEAKKGVLALQRAVSRGSEQENRQEAEAEAGNSNRQQLKAAQIFNDVVPQPVRFYLDLISPYLNVSCYPGSPLIERSLMRSDCPLSLCELHPEEVKKLRENIEGKNGFIQAAVTGNSGQENRQDFGLQKQQGLSCRATLQAGQKKSAKIFHTDGLKNLFASTPPAIKRGAVLIDPAYEEKNEFDDVANTVCKVHKKWSAGIIAIWYPLLANKKSLIEKMLSQITAAAKSQNANTSVLRAEFLVDKEDAHIETTLKENAATNSAPRLFGSGMLVLNAPWKLDEQLEASLQFLCGAIYQDGNTAYSVQFL